MASALENIWRQMQGLPAIPEVPPAPIPLPDNMAPEVRNLAAQHFGQPIGEQVITEQPSQFAQPFDPNAMSRPGVPDQYTSDAQRAALAGQTMQQAPQAQFGRMGATGQINQAPSSPQGQQVAPKPSRGAMETFIENLPRLALGAVSGLAPRPIPYRGVGGFLGLGALRGLQGAAGVASELLDPMTQAKLDATAAATARANAEAEYARAHANAPIQQHAGVTLRDPRTLAVLAPAEPDPRLAQKKENDANYQRFLKTAQDLQKAKPNIQWGDIIAHLADQPEFMTIPATSEYPGIQRAHEVRAAGTAAEHQSNAFANQSTLAERRSADSERRFIEAQARLERNLADPHIKPNEAPLWVDQQGNSLGRSIIGQRLSQIPFGAVPLKDASDLRALGMAKRLVYVNDKLDALAPEILKTYGGDGIRQVWDVQSNRLILVPKRGGGNPKLKEFEAYLNDSLITLPQAMGIPGSRESMALLKRMETGTGSLGDTVESMRAVNAANLGTVTAPLVARGIDILSNRQVEAPAARQPGTSAPPPGPASRQPTAAEIAAAKKRLGIP